MRARILVVEDNPDIVEMITAALEVEGYDVRSALDERALECARDWQPALILLDLTMPRMDGFEIGRRLHADPLTAAIPIVVMSAQFAPGELPRALSANGHLRKPFHLTELYSVVEAWTAHAQTTSTPAAEPSAPKEDILVLTTVDEHTYRTYARTARALESSTPALLRHLLCGVAPVFDDAASHIARSPDDRGPVRMELSTTLTLAHGGLKSGDVKVALSPEAVHQHERVMQTVARARDLLEAAGYVHARAQAALDRAQATSNRWARRDSERPG
jgi:CheY-like chemotaxis protein